MVSRPSILGFAGVPTVSVADGNVLRILVEALREWVRIATFRRRVAAVLAANPSLEKRVETICRPPSPAALAAALARMGERSAPNDAILVHAGPAAGVRLPGGRRGAHTEQIFRGRRHADARILQHPRDLTYSMKKPLRPLEGCLVSLSLSASPDLARHGFVPRDVDRALLALAESLLGAGARLLFGHDWRPGGIMETVTALAVAYQPPTGKDRPAKPLILNRLALPDQPFLAPAQPTAERMRDEPSDVDHSDASTPSCESRCAAWWMRGPLTGSEGPAKPTPCSAPTL